MGRGASEDIGPERPGIVRSALHWWGRQEFQLVDRDRTLSVRRSKTVRPGVPTTNDHHALPARRDEALFRNEVSQTAPVLQRQVFHGKMDPIEIASGHAEIAGQRGAPGQQDGVKRAAQGLCRNLLTHVCPRAEHNPLGRHELKTPVKNVLLQFEFWDPVAHQAPDAIRPLEDRHPVARPIELLRSRQARRAGAHHRHALPRPNQRGFGLHPSLPKAALDDLQFDLLDRDRLGVDPEDAGTLARGRTQPTRELGEVVGGQQTIQRPPPLVPVHEVVPVRDDVFQGAALMAKRDPAVHAARPLGAQRILGQGQIDLVVVADPLLDGPPLRHLALDFQEPGRVTHVAPPTALPTRALALHSAPSPGPAGRVGSPAA